MKRASRNGLHRRWYAKHRIEKLKKTRERNIERNPVYGVQRQIRLTARGEGDVRALIDRLGEALTRISEEGNRRRHQPKDRKRRLSVRK